MLTKRPELKMKGPIKNKTPKFDSRELARFYDKLSKTYKGKQKLVNTLFNLALKEGAIELQEFYL